MASSTPSTTDRDPVIDAVRAGSIAVVVLWHWVFSVTHWTDGRLTMPNPVDDIPAGWLLTWLFQVMPLFFVCGGVANRASYDGSGAAWVRPRVRGLVVPAAMYLGIWLVLDAGLQLLSPSLGPVWTWGMVVFVPLWFLGVYLGVVVLTPLTARLHEAAPLRTIVGLGVLVSAGETLRFGLGVESVALLTAAIVWVVCHQLGYLWRDGALRGHGGLTAGAGLALLALLSSVGPYPASMVATEGADLSNLFPTTAMVLALAVFQVGLLELARPVLVRWLSLHPVRRAVRTANALAMPVFLWHMTALVAVIGLFHLAGGTLGSHPSPSWWSTRPLWLVAPGALLALLLVLMARVSPLRGERPQPGSRPRPGPDRASALRP